MLPRKKMHFRVLAGSLILPAVFGLLLIAAAGQQAQQNPPPNPPQKVPPIPPPPNIGPPLPGGMPPRTGLPEIKKLSDNLLQLGKILVDVQKKEITVPGRMQSDRTLEFLATTKMGMKSYESAMELDTDAVSFNLSLIMIGLEKSHAVVPRGHFDPSQAVGDPVEIWVEWGSGDAARKVRGEELVYDLRTKSVPPLGQWVYTGSTVLPDGRYLSEMDGVLIGFVHDPASVIENSTGGGIGAYGAIHINPNLNIAPDTPLKVTIKALPKQKKD